MTARITMRNSATTAASRRTRFKLGTGLAALSLAAFGMPIGGVMLPSAAWAIDCSAPAVGDDVTDAVTCGYNSLGDAEIDITLVDDTDVYFYSTFVTSDGVTIVGPPGAAEDVRIIVETLAPHPAPDIVNDLDADGAFNVSTSGADSDVNFTLNNGTLRGGLALSEGLVISTAGATADIVVNTAAGTTIDSDQEEAIVLTTTGGGSITADVRSTVNAGGVGFGFGNVGILVATNGGDIRINTYNTTTITTGVGNGIQAEVLAGGVGDIRVDVTGSVIDTDDIPIPTAGLIFNGNGVYASNSGTGGITINVLDTSVPGPLDDAVIRAVHLSDDHHGIVAFTDATGTGSIAIVNEADITASGTGINATIQNAASAGTINITHRDSISSSLNDGIFASTIGTGGVTINTAVGSSIAPNPTGAGDGIDAFISNAGSSATLQVNHDGTLTSATDDGVQVAHNGSGLIDLNINGDITGGNSNNLSDARIQANQTGSGNIDVYTGVDSTIIGTGLGIEARTNAGSGNVIMDLNGALDTSFMELYVNTGGAATATITNAGTINASGSAGDLVADILGGETTFTNDGSILGRIDLTGSDDTFNNNSSSTWTFVGIQDFGPGADILNNTSGAPTFGRIVNAVDTATAETAQYDSLETFNNDGMVSLVDQAFGDVFLRDRAYTDGDYNGGGLATTIIEVDADLSSVAASDADRFIIGGEATGTTYVTVNDIGGGLGEFDEDGIPVILIADDGGFNDFLLTNGPIDKGLYSYDLFYTDDLTPYNADNNNPGSENDATDGLTGPDPVIEEAWVLRSYEDATVYNLAALPGIAGTTFAASTEGWIDRSGDYRDDYMDDGDAHFGIWGRVIGAGGTRTATESVEILPDQFVDLDTGYSEMLFAGQGGADVGFNMGDMTLVVGALGGYTTNAVAFNSGDTAQFSGPTAGVYGSLLSGGFYADALVKADWLNLDYDIGGLDSGSTAAVTWGGAFEAGYRAQWDTLFIEPVGRVSISETTIDTITIGVDDVDFAGRSLRAEIGGRAGTSFDVDGMTVAPYLSGFVGNEFVGESSVEVTSTGTTAFDFTGVYSQLGGGIDIGSMGGFTGFASGHAIIAEDYLGGIAKAGVRGTF